MSGKKDRKQVPSFRSEREEREFWRTHDAADYLDLSKAERAIFPNLKTTTQTISIRLPAGLLAEIKRLANQRDVPYQSLVKMFLSERVRRESRSA